MSASKSRTGGRIGVTDVLLAALSLALAAGVATVFHACVHEDGSIGVCHWAQQAVMGIGVALSLLAGARLFFSARAKMGADAAFIVFAALAAATPGGLIRLCGMATMRCRTLTQPATLVLAVLIAVTAAVDLILQHRRAA